MSPVAVGARCVEQVMGMPVTVTICDQDVPEAAFDEVFGDFAKLDRVFSPFRDDSAVSRLNRGDSVEGEAAALLDHALNLCRLYERATHGYFSARASGELDMSGLVKGWAIDRACSILDRRGCRNFFVDAGGDVQTRGSGPSGKPWRVGIRHPIERDKVVRVILASRLAVATSGTYEKGHHIVNPHTGTAATEFVSLTVVGPDILDSDVYATAAFAMGRAGLDFMENVAGYEAFAIDREMRGIWTAGFDRLCEPRIE